MSTDDTYNGWINRESWAAALWLNNDEGLYRWTRESIADAVRHGERLDEATRLFVDDMFDGLPAATASMRNDIGSLWRVDWQAVGESLFDEDELAELADYADAGFVR